MVSFLRRRKHLEVDAGVLDQVEKDSLVEFLRSALGVGVVLGGGRVSVESEDLSGEELRRLVNKFVYHRNLHRVYWVALEGDVVRIRKFEKAKKREKRRRETTPPQTITHGW